MTRPFEELTPADLRRRTSLKWALHDPGVIPVWVAEMDVLLAPEVADALTEAIRLGDTGYEGAWRTYPEAFAEFAEQRWDWQPDVGGACLCADVMTGIALLVEALTEPGEHVAIPVPVYPPFLKVAEQLGRHVAPVPLGDDGRLDVAAVDAALAASGARVLLLCSPHNPTGAVHAASELAALAAVADRHGATVVADEVHAPLVPEGATFVPWLSVVDSGFVVTSAAKTYNLAGLKAGLILAARASRPVLRSLPESVRYGASHLGVIGHVAGWRSGPSWLDAVNANIVDNRELLRALLAERLPQVRYRVPEATYLAWLDCRDLGLGDDPADAFLRRGRVALTPGPPFGPGGAGHARLNLACSAAVLEEAVDRMAATVG